MTGQRTLLLAILNLHHEQCLPMPTMTELSDWVNITKWECSKLLNQLEDERFLIQGKCGRGLRLI